MAFGKLKVKENNNNTDNNTTNKNFKRQTADPVLTHWDSEIEQITYQSPLDDVTLNLSTDQSRSLHHNNLMCLAEACQQPESMQPASMNGKSIAD